MRVKDKRKFVRFLVLLAIFIVTISCGVKKMMAKPEAPQMIKEEIKVDMLSKNKTPLPLEDTSLKKKPLTVEKETKEEEPKEKVIQEVSEKIEKEKKVTSLVGEYKFIKNNALYVYNDSLQNKRIDILRKGTRIKITEEKTVTRDNKKKTVVKIKYKKDLKERIGWVSKVNFADSLDQVLPKKWGHIDFENTYIPQNYQNNPRVDVKGVYLNIYSIGSERKLAKLIKLANETEINAFVIDVKDDNGTLAFNMDIPKKFGIPNQKSYPVKDINKFMELMKKNNIYTIARIVSFKDPKYAKYNPEKAIITRATGKPYTNSDGIIWVSAHDRNLWEYNIDVAKAAAKAGFNEIQFDYVRFPASNGGKLDAKLNYRNTENESKPETIQKYLRKAKEELAPLHVYTSADVYGQVGTFSDDMGLGQHWESVSQVVDYISPMMYPSHYGKGAYGVKIPDAQPYKIIYHSVRDSVNRNENIDNPAIIRPWLQAFTATWVKGYIRYNEKEIREQIKAMNDMGVKEYLLWSPSNNYKMTAK